MKAVVYENYGGPEVLQIKEIDKPSPKENEVLIKVNCTSINPFEWHHMRGAPFFARFSMGLLKPKKKILGVDVAGEVIEVGRKVKDFHPGDAVFGFSDYGGLAEHVCLAEDKCLHKPESLSFAEVAATPIAGITAFQSVRKIVQLRPGKKVLINGSSGGVGSYAVQIAKAFQLHVTGVCSTKNVELVKSLGADQVIDYKKDSVLDSGQRYDLVIDNVGNLSLGNLKKLVNAEGTGIVVGYTTLGNIFPIMIKGKPGEGKITVLMAENKKEDMQELLDLMVEGKVKSVLDRYYSMDKIVEAMTYLETLHAPGKVIIQINGEPDVEKFLTHKQTSII